MRPTRLSPLLLVCVLASGGTAARAQVVRLEITSREPMNNGQAAGTTTRTVRSRPRQGARGNRSSGSAQSRSSRISTLRRGTPAATSSTWRPSPCADPSTRRGARLLLYQVVNRGNGDVAHQPRGRHRAGQRLAGRRRADCGQSDHPRPDRKQRRRFARHRRSLARFVDVPPADVDHAHPSELDGQRPAGVPPRGPRSGRRDAGDVRDGESGWRED